MRNDERATLDLKYLKKCPDLHYNNLGIDKNGNIVLFDFTDFKRIKKLSLLLTYPALFSFSENTFSQRILQRVSAQNDINF